MQKISIQVFYIFFSLLFAIPSGFSQERAKDDFRKKVKEAASVLTVSAPDMLSPVSVNASAIWSNDKEQLAVIMKVEILEDWHIYAHVPADQPYIQSELRLSAPDALTPLEKWELPVPYPYSDGIFVYKGSVVFIRYFSVKQTVRNKAIEVGLYYQTCNISECLPPELEMIKLRM